MPKQINSEYNEVAIPFSKMTFSPDVPSSALGPNEYNDGINVEADVRGIRSTAGDQDILSTCPGTPTYISSGFRNGGEFWFIVATTEGYWYATNGTTVDWYDITPGLNPIEGYAQNTNITEAWNGTIPFFNDCIGPPMFLPESTDLVPLPKMVQYSNLVKPTGIDSISYFGSTTQRLVFSTPYTSAPYIAGQQIVITGVNNYYNGTYTVVQSFPEFVIYKAVPGAAYPGTSDAQQVAPAYTWNYNPNWSSVVANFLRIYSTPNVGSILVAGNLVATPNVQVIGNFTLDSATVYTSAASSTWVGATVYSASMPRGTIIETVVPGVSFQTNAQATQSATDEKFNIGLTSKENYPVTVQWSQNFGLNQAPRSWEPTVTNVANQLEVPLRGVALDAFPCNGNFFLCSYWDTVVFSPLNYSTTSAPILGVRLFNQGRGLLSANCWGNTDKNIYGIDARDIWVFNGTDFQGLGNQRVKNWFYDQLDPQYYDRVFMQVNTQKNQIEIYYPDSQATDGVPNKMLAYRYELDVWNAPREVSRATMACESPIWIQDPDTSEWSPNLGSRTVVYARGVTEEKIVQKDIGYTFPGNLPITSRFRRDNVKLLKDYSGKVMVHRLLPEAVNLGATPFNDHNFIQLPVSTGNLSVKVQGANSVGQAPKSNIEHTIQLNTDNPWMQIDQNAFRVNSIEISNTSNTDVWMVTATTWQYTQVEDDR